MSHTLPSLEQQEALCYGYCRINYAYNIPFMLINIILSFYNDIYYWTLKGDKLKEFLSATNETEIDGKPFKVENITWNYVAQNDIVNGNVDYGIRMIRISDVIEYVIVNNMVYNKELNIFKVFCCKSTVKIPGCITSFCKLSECKNLNDINFYNKLDIIRIQPKDISKYGVYHKPGIKMNKSVELKWTLNDDLLNRMKSRNGTMGIESYYSMYFDDDNNWISRIYRSSRYKYYYFFIYLLRLPRNVKQIKLKYTLKLNKNNENVFNKTNVAIKNYDNINDLIDAGEFEKDLLSNAITLTLFINIEILKVFDFNDDEVDPHDWIRYLVI